MKIKTKRLQKKYLKIVADRLAAGQEVPRFYFFKIERHFENYQIKNYVEKFRPMLHEVEADLNWQDLRVEHMKKTNAEYEQKYGVDTKLLCRYSNALRRNKSKRMRKPRKEKPAPPIRKLKNPLMYKIRVGGNSDYRVVGEPAFEYRGLKFFIHHFKGLWTVSEKESGLQVIKDKRYKQAIAKARKLIEENFDKVKEALRGRGI